MQQNSYPTSSLDGQSRSPAVECAGRWHPSSYGESTRLPRTRRWLNNFLLSSSTSQIPEIGQCTSGRGQLNASISGFLLQKRVEPCGGPCILSIFYQRVGAERPYRETFLEKGNIQLLCCVKSNIYALGPIININIV